MSDPTQPNGEYNKRTGNFSEGVDAKRIKKFLWPAGNFNNQDGPLSAIQHADGSMKSMSQNLTTNQTVMTSYINTPRLMVPVNIPSLDIMRDFSLTKCIGSGDVVFALRYNSIMLAAGTATPVTRKFTSDLLYCVNLATLNYILIGIQHVMVRTLRLFSTDMVIDVDTFRTEFDVLKQFAQPEELGTITRRWIMFLESITGGDFVNMIKKTLCTQISTLSKACDKEEHEKFPIIKKAAMDKEIKRAIIAEVLWDFINTYSKPSGIFVGSDEQGGAHYGNSNPCSFAPTDFVGVIQVAGKNMKVRNMWSACGNGTSSGDILGFKLRYHQFQDSSAAAAEGAAKSDLSVAGMTNLPFELSTNGNTPMPKNVSLDSLFIERNNASKDTERVPRFFLLVPAKKYLSTSMENTLLDTTSKLMQDELDTGFLQFGMCDQMSKPSNVYNSFCRSAVNATAASAPLPFQIYMRMGFIRQNTSIHMCKGVLSAIFQNQSEDTSTLDVHPGETRPNIAAAVHHTVLDQTTNTNNNTISNTTLLDTHRQPVADFSTSGLANLAFDALGPDFSNTMQEIADLADVQEEPKKITRKKKIPKDLSDNTENDSASTL